MTKGAIIALMLASASPTALAEQVVQAAPAPSAATRPAAAPVIQFRNPGARHKHWQDLRSEKHAALVRAFEPVLGLK